MFILLPARIANMTELITKGLTPEIISEIVEPNYMVERPIELELPKFKVEQRLDSLVPVSKQIFKKFPLRSKE